ncbi:hypothetical protein, partial [Agrococcus casei]|uniref:hypothetical protein n=1 Tax=Agrococcus casei TaxID=343512 RepID=UPI003F905911
MLRVFLRSAAAHPLVLARSQAPRIRLFQNAGIPMFRAQMLVLDQHLGTCQHFGTRAPGQCLKPGIATLALGARMP